MEHIYESVILIDQATPAMAEALENADCGVDIAWTRNQDLMERDPRGIYQMRGTFQQLVAGEAWRTSVTLDTISRFAIGWIRGVLEHAQRGGSEVTICFCWKRIDTRGLPGDLDFSYVPDPHCQYCGWSPEMRAAPLDENGYCVKCKAHSRPDKTKG